MKPDENNYLRQLYLKDAPDKIVADHASETRAIFLYPLNETRLFDLQEDGAVILDGVAEQIEQNHHPQNGLHAFGVDVIHHQRHRQRG